MMQSLKALLAALLTCANGLLWNSRNLDDGHRQRGADWDDYHKGAGPPPPPRRRESSCIHVDHVCGSLGRGWLYGPPSGHQEFHQPTMTLLQNSSELEKNSYLSQRSQSGQEDIIRCLVDIARPIR